MPLESFWFRVELSPTLRSSFLLPYAHSLNNQTKIDNWIKVILMDNLYDNMLWLHPITKIITKKIRNCVFGDRNWFNVAFPCFVRIVETKGIYLLYVHCTTTWRNHNLIGSLNNFFLKVISKSSFRYIKTIQLCSDLLWNILYSFNKATFHKLGRLKLDVLFFNLFVSQLNCLFAGFLPV